MSKVTGMAIGSEIYRTLVRYAEGGERVTKVVLPKTLFDEYMQDAVIQQTMKVLDVKVEYGEVREPQFQTGEIK